VTGSTLALVAWARSDVLAASPYFVPGARGVEAMKQAVPRNVRMSVMTNSLATTDEPLVYFGYARYRSALLKTGVRLYELMPTAVQQGANSTLQRRGSLGGLHAKLLVVDHRHLFIGSMNLDQRSARLNTEIGLVIDSSEIANEVTRVLQRDRLPSSYRLRLAAGSDAIEWVSGREDAERVSTSEPDTGKAQQLRLWVTSRFIGEEML
jgi:putative cardiolipin synthase